jgi:hypothetical protein
MLHRGNAQVPSTRPLAVERQTDTFKANISFDDVPKSALLAADFLASLTKKARLIP